MNGLVKTILIILGILLLIPVLGIVVRTFFGLIMALIGLVIGILAIPFSLIGGLIGLFVGLLFLGIPILILVAIAGLGVWVLSHAFGGKSEKRKRTRETDVGTMRDIQRGLDDMEKRLDSLETILSDR
ncbi:MAG: hypothetical protein H6751_01995 [Candidatus Omnitrophica bacterium]|nr:hypothetical protein [Candidatus Omnitrophota bacterium]MCA9439404.1 hypothetical protein [Candidatus Omnitrophota bacterium]MCB9768873.1 hypothetical protein [Candidatus Omnitrophota bacterium]MCB9781719.1 hypothetical protein [Candidatus Omnitrophota bacterium]